MTNYSSSEDSTEEPEIIAAKRERRRIRKLTEELERKKRVCRDYGRPELAEKLDLENPPTKDRQPLDQQTQAEALILEVFGKTSQEIYHGWLTRIKPFCYRSYDLKYEVIRTSLKINSLQDYAIKEEDFEKCLETPEEKFNRIFVGLKYFYRPENSIMTSQKIFVDREGDKDGLFWYEDSSW